MSFLLSLTLICFKIYAPKTSSYFTKWCTNFLFMVMHTSTWLNTNCLLAQSLICLHTHTQTLLEHSRMRVKMRVWDRDSPWLLPSFCSPLLPPPISLFPSRPQRRHAVLFLAYWCFFIIQCLFVAQKNYRGLPGCWRQQCRAAEADREREKEREQRNEE